MLAPGTPLLLPLHRLLFATHDVTWEHVDRYVREPETAGPVQVEPLLADDGSTWWFILDGRHRATAAYERGETHVRCEVAYV